MILIDTHCHVNKKEDLSKLIEEAHNNEVKYLVISYCEKKEIEQFSLNKSSSPYVYYTLGYHPSEAGGINDQDLHQLSQYLSCDQVIGLGEIGLDYHYGTNDQELQKELFRKQLKIAEEKNLPVVIHSRDATLDTINILKEYSVKGVIHCFSGSLETAREYIKMGFYLGIGGVVTFSNSKLKDVVEKLPLTSIVLETDSPYLAPVPFRGEENSSKNIAIIAQFIAQLKQISKEEVALVTTGNVERLFDHRMKM